MALMATKEEVEKLAALARIHVPQETLDKFVAEFDAVLGYVSQLEELTVEKGTANLPYVNVFREDGEPHEPGTWTEALVAQFPARDGNSLSVKQIISHD